MKLENILLLLAAAGAVFYFVKKKPVSDEAKNIKMQMAEALNREDNQMYEILRLELDSLSM